MNEAQHRLYLFQWGKARRALRAAGVSASDCEAQRKRIHFLVGAYWWKFGKIQIKSSKMLSNRDIDLFIAHCKSIAESSDVRRQLRELEMPKTRALYATKQLLDAIGIPEDKEHRASYLEGILKKRLEDSDEEDLQRLIAACNHTLMHKVGKDHNHPRTGKGPQSRFAHQVGARSRENCKLSNNTPLQATFNL